MKKRMMILLVALLALSAFGALAEGLVLENEPIVDNAVAGPVNANDASIPSDAKAHNGHYYKLYNSGKTWSEAKRKCESLGGHLVTITKASEQQVIEKLLDKGTKNSYWIGGHFSSSNKWCWVTGEKWNYTNWAGGQPDNFTGTEFGLMVYRNSNPLASSALGSWNDLNKDCTCKGESFFGTENFGFICEWDSGKPALGTPTNLTVSLSKDSDDDICTVTARSSSVKGADGYVFEAKGQKWSQSKSTKATSKEPSVNFTIRKGEKVEYRVRAYQEINKDKKYSDWFVIKKSIISDDETKSSVSSVLKTTSAENNVSDDYDTKVGYRIVVVDYKYNSEKDMTYLTAKLTMYFNKKPMNWGGTMIMAVDNLKKGDDSFHFVEDGSKGYITYSKWSKKLEPYKKKKLIVSVDDNIDSICVADFKGAYGSGVSDRKSYANFTAKWVASGKVTDFRVKGTVLLNTKGTNSDTTYSFSPSGGSVSIKISEKTGIRKGRWASVTCRM